MSASVDQLEQQPTPPPTPRRPAGGLTFRQPEEHPTPLPHPATSDETTSRHGQPDEASSAGESHEPSDLHDESDPSSSRTSPAAGADRPLSKAALRGAIAQGILTGSDVAHRLLARSEAQRAVGLYRADQEDADGIASPLASIASRRGGVAGKVSPDAADALAALIALAGYGSKQIALQIAVNEHELANRAQTAAAPVDV